MALLSVSFPLVVYLMAWIVRRLVSLGEATAGLVQLVKDMQDDQAENHTALQQLTGEIQAVGRALAELTGMTHALDSRVTRLEGQYDSRTNRKDDL